VFLTDTAGWSAWSRPRNGEAIAPHFDVDDLDAIGRADVREHLAQPRQRFGVSHRDGAPDVAEDELLELAPIEIASAHARRLALISRIVAPLWWLRQSETHLDRSQNSARLPRCGIEWCTSLAGAPQTAQRGCSRRKAARAASHSRV
jgi:hypothetical protein